MSDSYRARWRAASLRAGSRRHDPDSYRGRVEQSANDVRADYVRQVLNQNIRLTPPKTGDT
jgi:hypothetical protein